MPDENSPIETLPGDISANNAKRLSAPKRRRWVLLALLGISITGGLLFIRPHLRSETLQQLIEQWGAWAPLGFIGFYGVVTVLMLPGSFLTVVGGFIFGPIWGTLFSLIGATIGATLAFLVARYLAGDWAFRKLRAQLPTIQKSIEQDGWKYVMVTRLVPLVPFNLLNYAFGLTSIRLLPYILVTFVFMIPGAFAYTYVGYATRTVVGGVMDAASVKQVLGGISMAVGLMALLWLVRKVWMRRASLELPEG